MQVSIRGTPRDATRVFELERFNDRRNVSWGCRFVPLDNPVYLQLLEEFKDREAITAGRTLGKGLYNINYRLKELNTKNYGGVVGELYYDESLFSSNGVMS